MSAPGEMQSIPTLFEDQGKDTTTSSFSQEKLEGLERHILDVTASITEPLEPPPHELIPDLVLEKVATAFDPRKMPKIRHRKVLVINAVLSIARKQGWGLGFRNGRTYVYNGCFWKPIEDDVLRAFLGRAAERMGIDNLDAEDCEFRDKLHRQFMSAASITVAARPKNAVLINLQNGPFEIGPGHIQKQEFRAEYFFTYQLPFAYDPEAKASKFQKFLDRVQPDMACQRVLAEAVASLFVSKDTLKLEKMLLLYGSGANGKSVFFEIISALLGPENVSNHSIKNLTDEQGYYRAEIADKLVNYCSEVDGIKDTNLFKALVSGEPVGARRPHRDACQISNYAKLMANCNELPHNVEHNEGFFRRFLIVRFGITIPKEERDPELANIIIRTELSGVFNWVLEGLSRLIIQKGFTQSEAVEDQVEAYKNESNSIFMFLDACNYQADPAEKEFELQSDLYHEYATFCRDHGYRAVSDRVLKSRLEAYDIVCRKSNGSRKVYVKKITATM